MDKSKVKGTLKWVGITLLVIISFMIFMMIVGEVGNSREYSYSPSYDSMIDGGLGLTADSGYVESNGFGSSIMNNFTSSKSESSMAINKDMNYPVEYPGFSEGEQVDTSINTSDPLKELSEDKLVYKASIGVETEDYDSSIKTLNEIIDKYSGVIESSEFDDGAPSWIISQFNQGLVPNTFGWRSAYYTVRIPTKDFENFMTSMGDIGRITSSNSSVENITKRYNNTQAQIESLELQLENLLKMYDKAETISDMLEIESRVRDVESSLNSYKSELNTMNIDVAYSTISVSIREVQKYNYSNDYIERLPFGERFKATLSTGWDDFTYTLTEMFFWVIENIFNIILFAIIVFIVVAIRKLIVKLRNKRRAKKLNKTNKDDKVNQDNSNKNIE